MQKIAIDARMYGKGFGLARYVESLVHGLEKYPSDFSYTLYLKPESIEAYRKAGGNLTVIEAPYHWYGWEEQTKFLSLINKGTHDLMHFPHWNMPILYHRLFVITIHDLTMFHFPRYEATTRSPLIFWVKDKVHKLVVGHAARSAKEIITTSEFSKQDIIQTLKVPKEKIGVIYQAPRVHTIQGKSWEELQASLSLIKPYVLYVGAAYPHKNLKRLLEAWKIVSSSFPEHELVLVGNSSVFYVDLEEYIQKMNIPNTRTLGFVEDENLGTLYAHATAVVFPSLYEGFGLPPLEAMASGTPVIASSGSCLPEILGEAAYYVDQEDVGHIAQGISAVLTNPDIRSELRLKGREHVRSFSPELFVKNTLEVYRKAFRN